MLAALRLQIEWGADEALDDAPVNRLVSRAPMPTLAMQAVPVSGGDQARSAQNPAAFQLPTERVAAPAVRAEQAAQAAQTLAALREALASFDGCALSATATNLVFAEGPPESRLMLIGEAPGSDDDRLGKPFCGPHGEFLDRMLASIELNRSKLVLTTLIPWRPPGNRAATDSEVAICLPFLLRQIALVRPQRIVLLGAMATHAVLGAKGGINRLRGRWSAAKIPGLDQPVPALPMLPLGYLLNNPLAKREAWSDLLELRHSLNVDAL